MSQRYSTGSSIGNGGGGSRVVAPKTPHQSVRRLRPRHRYSVAAADSGLNLAVNGQQYDDNEEDPELAVEVDDVFVEAAGNHPKLQPQQQQQQHQEPQVFFEPPAPVPSVVATPSMVLRSRARSGSRQRQQRPEQRIQSSKGSVKPFNALYSCERCDTMWTVGAHSPKYSAVDQCLRCRHDYRPVCVIDTKGFKPEFSTSYYGEYQCSRGRCGRAWSSHQSWLGYQRQCPDCTKWIYPWLLRTHEWVGPDSLSTGNVFKRKARRSVGEHRSGFWARLWLIVAVVLVMAAVAAVVVATGAYDRLVPYVAPVVKDLMAKVDSIYANWGSD